jgi:KaiC/GvpD/RAD55 family RecA-like ATPase
VYDVSDSLPTESFPPGTSVLLSGPSDVDLSELLFDVLGDGARRGDGTILYATARDADGVRAALGNRLNGTDADVGVVDCVPSDGAAVGHTLTRHVSSPADFTAAGVAVSELLEEFGETHGQIRVGVDSVSDLLKHADVKTVFRFLHVLTGRIGAADAVGFATLDVDEHDGQTVTTVRQLFDGLVEVRTDGGRRIRVRGPSDVETDWQSF